MKKRLGIDTCEKCGGLVCCPDKMPDGSPGHPGICIECSPEGGLLEKVFGRGRARSRREG